MPGRPRLTSCCAALVACLLGVGVLVGAHGTPHHSPGAAYAATGLPDRIVLTPGADPARELAVAYRTDSRQAVAEVQLAPALDGPDSEARTRPLSGSSRLFATENGAAYYHQVRFTGLQPDTTYLYQAKGADGWSEWLQFHTAAAGFKPFRFIYLGDVQDDILTLGSRTIRQAFLSTASPALVVHAGDMVSQDKTLIHDDEWGEWNQAGGFYYAQVPQLPAIGNHEYLKTWNPLEGRGRQLSPHWPLQFVLPDNGAHGVEGTSYYVDFQGVRFIVLDGTAALHLGALESQKQWLEASLKDSSARWKVVIDHQPIFTCARPKDTEVLKAAWKPVLEKYNVDLVLQGHDHCYSRLSAEAGHEAALAARAAGAVQGPVYLVSVAGSKMYRLNDRARRQPDRVAEDTQFYETVEVESQRLAVRTYTASGQLYDAFDLLRDEQGGKHLVEPVANLPAERTCDGERGPDGLPCTALGNARG
ncbi:fibronectin type III domain-containing protein [Azorhizophilus paspali]|uniref:Fibronectin type III domain-containing protein n=1 Tax=Azorhizophilus paspali TaxID=69963 RepID=A0ABV6SL45_AZOPA